MPSPHKKTLNLFLVISAFLVPLLAAILLYTFRDQIPLRSHAAGELLVPPISLQPVFEHAPADLQIKGHWTLVALIQTCDEKCPLPLQKMDSVYRSLQQDKMRVRLLLLTTEIKTAFPPDLSPIAIWKDGSAFRLASNLLSSAARKAPYDGFYLIDPQGYAALYYPLDAPANALLRDLRHLLKVSRIG